MVNILSYQDSTGELVSMNQLEIAEASGNNAERANAWLSEQLGFQSVDDFLAVNHKTLTNVISTAAA